MTTDMSPAEQARWDELCRTAARVRAGDDRALGEPRSWRGLATAAASLVAVSGLAVAALHAAASAVVAHADGSADAALFSLTNQDRASNGVRSLIGNGTLQTVGEGGRYTGCGFAVNGRSVDMIQRNYFAHPILGCGQMVFSMMQAYGVHYLSAGENIGWNVYPGAAGAAAQINSAFMNSPEHRANILNGAFTDLGVGSDNSGVVAWTGGGGSYTNAWMFSEEFAQLRSAPAPPPPPPPQPVHTPLPTLAGGLARNSAAPTRPGQGPVTTTLPAAPEAVAVATPAPTATATATPTPSPPPGGTPLPGLTLPPPLAQPGGLLFDAVESVLESYLIH